MKPAKKNKTPIESMVDAVMGCVKCGAKIGMCDCWVKCPCGWLFEKGGKCRNPIHIEFKKEAGKQNNH